MEIAFLRGDADSSGKCLQEMEESLCEEERDIRYAMYDIACGFYHLATGKPERVPLWLKDGLLPGAFPISLENYANSVKARFYYQTRQYSTLLAYIENTVEKQAILYGKIELKISEALSRYQFKQPGKAFSALAEAYNLASPNKIITPFIQYAKDTRTLTNAALRHGACPVPVEWLEEINRKSSAYAKRKAKMMSAIRINDRNYEVACLSNREMRIMKDLAQGLSRSEIAAAQSISINTVKMAINTIYEKLGADNLADAIRIAINRKII